MQGLLERRVKLLEVASDRLRAAPCPDLWRSARPEALQAQMSAAVRFREGVGWVAHTHEVSGEILCAYDVRSGLPSADVVQFCACGSVRIAYRSRNCFSPRDWSLCGYVADYATDTGFLQSAADAPASAKFVVSLDEWSAPYSLADIGVLAESGGRPPALVERSGEASASGGSDSGVSCPGCGGIAARQELTGAGCVLCGADGGTAAAAVGGGRIPDPRGRR